MPRLQHKRPGEHISAAEYNAIVDAATAHQRSTYTRGEYGGDTSRTRYPIVAYSAVDVPAYSVFGITGRPAQDPDDPARVAVRAFNRGSPLLPCTNDGTAIPAGGWGVIRPVSAWENTKLRLVGGAGIGHPVGVRPDTFSLESGRFGFVVVGDCPPENGIDGLVYVTRCVEPCTLIGITETPILGIERAGRVPGQGLVKLLAMPGDASEGLRAARDPDDGQIPWLFVALNVDTEDIGSRTVVECHNAVAVGLVARSLWRDTGSESSSSGSESTSDSYEPPPEPSPCPLLDITVITGASLSPGGSYVIFDRARLYTTEDDPTCVRKTLATRQTVDIDVCSCTSEDAPDEEESVSNSDDLAGGCDGCASGMSLDQIMVIDSAAAGAPFVAGEQIRFGSVVDTPDAGDCYWVCFALEDQNGGAGYNGHGVVWMRMAYSAAADDYKPPATIMGYRWTAVDYDTGEIDPTWNIEFEVQLLNTTCNESNPSGTVIYWSGSIHKGASSWPCSGRMIPG